MKPKNLLTPSVVIFLIFALCLAAFVGIIAKGRDLFFSPTYTPEEIPQAIIEICGREYKLEEPVETKIAGKTLGARITAEYKSQKDKRNEKKAKRILKKIIKICKIDLTSTSNNPSWIKLHQSSIEEGLILKEDLKKALGLPYLTEETKKLLRNFSRSVSRVCMSTDAPIDFSNIIFRDFATKEELGKIAYKEDLIKAFAGWVSSIDYYYFRNITEKRLASYKSKYDEAVKLLLLAYSLKEGNPTQLTELKSIPVSPDQRLYYVKLEKEKSDDSQQLSNEFFLLVPEIEIYSVGKLPPDLQKYKDTSKWQEDELFIKDIAFKEFFTEQISQMTEEILNLIEDVKDTYIELYPEKREEVNLYIPEVKVKAELLTKSELDPNTKLEDFSSNTLKLTFKPEVKDEAVLEKLLDLCLWVTKNRCNTYELFDFSNLEVFNGTKKVILTMDKTNLFGQLPAVPPPTQTPAEPLIFQR